MENQNELLENFNSVSLKTKKCKYNKNSFIQYITGLYMLYVIIFLFTLLGLTTSLFIIENKFIGAVTPFVKDFQVPEFNMTIVVPTINKISNIIENICKNPEFEGLCK